MKGLIRSHLTILHADGSRRAFYKEFVKVVTTSDVIIEVLDARDPLGSRCVDAEKFIRRAGSDKKIILLLNKIGTAFFPFVTINSRGPVAFEILPSAHIWQIYGKRTSLY